MLWKKIAVTAAAGAALAAALPAYADSPHWGPSHGYRAGHWDNRHHRGHYHPQRHQVIVVQPRPYIYLPPRVVVLYPGPVYAPYPQPMPSHPGWDVNVGFRFGGMF
jgi:hypothetical protein